MTVALSEDARALWDAATALNRAAGAVSLPPLLFFTDGQRTPRPWETAARLPAGAGVVYRTMGAEDAGETARRLRDVTAARGVSLLIGADRSLAEAVEADGVHLPARLAATAGEIRTGRPEWLITAAVHAADADPLDGLSAWVASPVLPTASPSARPVLGLNALSALARRGPPVYALGGIDATTAKALSGTGVCGIAGVGAIQAAFGPAVRI